jgi:hypothetical protein
MCYCISGNTNGFCTCGERVCDGLACLDSIMWVLGFSSNIPRFGCLFRKESGLLLWMQSVTYWHLSFALLLVIGGCIACVMLTWTSSALNASEWLYALK